jgi:putative exporter of polyketide antibiotics
LVVITGVASTVGVLAFERRDIGQVGAVRLPSMPRFLLGTTGPLLRSFSERLTGSVAWGLGIGVYAIIIATSAPELQRVVAESPTLADMMRVAFPNADLGEPGFALQVLFVQLGTLLIGFAAAAIVGGWASDESDGRLELLLTTPIARAAWHVRTGLGAYLGIVLASLVVALAAAIGVATSGEDLLTPFTGSLVLVLYGTAMAGIGMAAGGWLRPTFAAPAVIIAVVGSLLIDILAPILELPQLVRDLALSSHFGEPMIGNWDPVGIVASLALAIGGLLLGAWGFARRDLSG